MTRKNKIAVGEDFRIAIHIVVKNFRQNDEQKEYEFPSSLSATERAYVHRYTQSLGLKSKSRGEGANRFLTVYKKEGSTIVQADAVFELGHISRRHTLSLLQRFPITARERQELLPPTERDRILGQESVRDVNRNIGRLGSGIPMVPPRKCDNEFTAFRQTLPIWNCQEEIIQMITCHQVVIISGETGSGKTTQVPQFIMDHCSMVGQPCRIICTQPRRIAAITVAERVALERDDKIGQTIGYQVRLESRISPKTLLTFCTNGVLLRTLMGGDASVATVTHILVDELHERDRYSDFLLIVLRDLILKFRNLKLVLMSASLDMQLFCKYFSNCPIIEVPGRAFEVKTFFLEDILKGTGYTNPAMIKYIKDIEKQKSRKKLESWCSVLNSEAIANSADDAPSETGKGFYQDLGLDSLSLHDIDNEREPTSHLTAAVDKVIEDVWVSGEDDFSYLMQLILSENVSVDYQHSETLVSPLMLAAGRGNIDVVEQLLVLGASIHIKSTNGWTAVDWAIQFGHKEIAELLTTNQWKTENSEQKSNNALDGQLEIQEEDKLLLDAYTHSVDEEKIDHDLILCLLSRIYASHEEGAVLIFLPGYDDIVTLRDRIISENETKPEIRVMLFTLHSQMQSSDQKRVFRPVLPGVRKVILSTNIAETSVTINDVLFVIDCGKVKEKSYDSLTGVTHLKAGWISKASAIQRRGRAGRCRPGLCYHLYSRARFNSFQKFQVPEILRVPIHELCLQAKLLAPPNAPIADFLAKAPDPPPFMVTRNAVTLLKTIDALDPWEELTELGLHLLDMPIEPRLGKMILYSVVLKCLDPVLTIVCCLAYRDPFILPSQPAQKRSVAMAKRKFSCDTFSDHMVLLRAFQAWQKAKVEGHERTFCSRNFISHATMEMIVGMRSQLLGQLRASGFIRPRGSGDIRDLNSNSEIWAVIKAALCAGTYPNLIRIDRDRQQLITQKESKVRFHHSSVLNKLPVSAKHSVAALRKQMMAEMPCDWLFYEEMMRTGSIAHAHCCTLVTPITVALFAGPARLPLDALHEPDQARLEGYMEEGDSEDDSKYDNQKAMFKIDDWISFRVEPEIARLVLQLRQKWHALFLKRMHAPTKGLTQADETVIRTIAGVLVAEDQALHLQQPIGIGQRPRPLMSDYTSPVHLRKPMSASPNHRSPSYFNPNNLYHSSGLSCYSDEMPGMSNAATSPSSYNSSFSSCSQQSSPMSMPFNPVQMSSKQEFSQPCVTNSRIRYFIIKANTSRVVEVSMAKNIWAFTATTERKLMSAMKEGKEVILIFSIQGSGHFQGFARFTPHLSDQRPPEFSAANLGTCYQIEWIKKANIPFQSTRHLQNAWNENRKVQISRDGQELEPSVGESLCKLIVKGQPVFTADSMKSSKRNMVYSRENFSDSSPLTRSQMQWDQNLPSSSSWKQKKPRRRNRAKKSQTETKG
ncbi:3'-5' RNA helicase YTHDC2-like isoform X2 [Argiope bruennichi]|uniref:3'-5' RNA helicase YTHDC2-like isoform X2 n=1 Tax=Argiope bruennichi TaxID=94029 RepID=UPI0024949D64|nr:3'-5' RNA helicase YTHDC2-like isoform X2 [Argiope bruennichi]